MAGRAAGLLALAAAALAAWLIVTLYNGAATAAGWRHELIGGALAGLAIFLAAAAEGRRWPQPAEVYALAALGLAIGLLAAPLPKLPGLLGLSALLLVGGGLALRAELRASRGGPRLARLAAALGLLDLMAVTPTFAALVSAGFLRPPL